MTLGEAIERTSHGSFTLQGCEDLSQQLLIARACVSKGFPAAIGLTDLGERFVLILKKELTN